MRDEPETAALFLILLSLSHTALTDYENRQTIIGI